MPLDVEKSFEGLTAERRVGCHAHEKESQPLALCCHRFPKDPKVAVEDCANLELLLCRGSIGEELAEASERA